MEAIIEAGNLVAHRLADDGVLHTFGTGHSHMVAEEIAFRAGGLAPVNVILEPSLTGNEQASKAKFAERMEGWGKIILDYHKPLPQDCLIVISNSGRNAAPIDVAWEAQRRQVPVIAILSRAYCDKMDSRHSSGKKLTDVADLVIDNCGELGDASVKLEGLEAPIGPTSNISATFIIHLIIVRAIEALIEKGIQPPVLLSGNLNHSDSPNEQLIRKYWGRVRY